MGIEERFMHNLKSVRAAWGFTQVEVGEKCGLWASHISHFETGRRVPSLQSLEKLTSGLECSYHELLD